MLVVRWATWWPAPYWIDRFNYLSSVTGVTLEAIFLSAGASIQGWRIDKRSWKFRYVTLSEKMDSSGYFHFHFRFPRPWRLVRGRVEALVMPYADLTCLTAAFLCWLTRKPYVLFVANTPKDLRQSNGAKEYLKRIVFLGASGILATGELQMDYALRYVHRSKIYVIGNPAEHYGDLRKTNLEHRQGLRNELGWRDRVVLLYVGRLSEEKGLSALLEAMAECTRKGLALKLVLAGAGPLEDALREMVTRLEVDVELPGFLQREQLARYYAASDVFVLPSKSEAWGLVVNEAMEFGLPLILSDRVGAAPALLKEGETGLLFPVGDAAALAACIEKLCLDEGLRKRMGEAASLLIEGHSIVNWANAVIVAIRKVRHV